jgi:hypothetical protein
LSEPRIGLVAARVKSASTPEIVEAVRQIEERADQCFGSLKLLGLHANVALWSMLVGAIKVVEEQIGSHGDNSAPFDAALINISRFVPVAMKWIVNHAKRASALASRHWTPSLDGMVREALSVASDYDAFLGSLPMWHKDQFAVELISPTLGRITRPGSAKDRQVSAYQKGIRPKEGTYRGQRKQKVEQTLRVHELFERVKQTWRKTGRFRFEYGEPWTLWLELLPEYQARVNSIARRHHSLSLGDYSLGEFNQFYAAFLAVCAAQEFLCFEWGRSSGQYPFDSAVLVRSRSSWTATLSELSEIAPTKCESIIRDLTFDFSRSLDLHIHPFVPLEPSKMTLAVTPQFPLHSRPDENILRVCSMLRPAEFNAASLEKELEMRTDLEKKCTVHAMQGPVLLPKPNPDIDLIVTDENSSTIVIAELKWIRKPARAIEMIDRDAEVLKGISQLEQIRRFLIENPSHLSSQGKLPRPMDQYANIYYLLVARDHWLWVEPTDGIAIVEFDALVNALSRPDSLHSAMSELLKYEWLPIEGRDFSVPFGIATANGVSIEFEVYYAK